MVPISSPLAWGGNQVKSYSIVSFRGKASSHGKGCSCVVLPPSAIVFLFRLRGERDFFHPIVFPNEIVECAFLGSSSGNTVLSLTHVQGKSHPSVESRWAQRRRSCLPSEKFRPSGCHGNGMLPTKHCDTTEHLREERRVMGPKWKALTITSELLYIRQPELMIWSYVDTKLRMIHWMYWTIG